MTPQDITTTLSSQFDAIAQTDDPLSWQVQANGGHLLVLLSDDQTWMQALVSIAPLQAAQPYVEQLMEANFDQTQEVRYAFYEGVLWGVFQHSLASLTQEDFQRAIARLLYLQQKGLQDQFNQLAETQIRQIIRAAKLQGQSLETTLQTLQRFYAEGVMGGIDANAQEREQFMQAWRYQLERLWHEAD